MNENHDTDMHTVPPDRRTMAEQPKWRRDFPIDVAQDSYVARRDFTKYLGLTSLAFVVGQVCIGLQNLWRRARGALPVVEIARLNDVPLQSARAFFYPTEADPAILLRLGETELLAFSSQCTHLQCPVLPDIEKKHFHCPCHAGFFDLQSGQPLAGPPRRPLPQIALRVRNAIVYAEGFQESSS